MTANIGFVPSLYFLAVMMSCKVNFTRQNYRNFDNVAKSWPGAFSCPFKANAGQNDICWLKVLSCHLILAFGQRFLVAYRPNLRFYRNPPFSCDFGQFWKSAVHENMAKSWPGVNFDSYNAFAHRTKRVGGPSNHFIDDLGHWPRNNS